MPRSNTVPPGYTRVGSIDAVIPHALRARLKPYARLVGARRASDYVRYCVVVTTELLQAKRRGAKLLIIEQDGELWDYSLGTRELGNDTERAAEIFREFEL